MSNINHTTLAHELLTVYRLGEMIATPFSAREPALDLNAAYAVEAEFARLRMQQGHGAVGRKVGFANKAMWRALKLDTLIWARMYDDTVQPATEPFSLAGSRAPKIEPEIVFKLKKPLDSAVMDATAVLEATEWLAIGFEIVDCPFPDWQFKPVDFVAAYGLHTALLVGQPLYLQPDMLAILAEELPRFKIKLFKEGQLVEEGSGKNSLRSPALCVAELAAAALRQPGVLPLAAGELISTGSLTAAQPIAQGETWQAEVEGLPLAPVSATFT